MCGAVWGEGAFWGSPRQIKNLTSVRKKTVHTYAKTFA